MPANQVLHSKADGDWKMNQGDQHITWPRDGTNLDSGLACAVWVRLWS